MAVQLAAPLIATASLLGRLVPTSVQKFGQKVISPRNVGQERIKKATQATVEYAKGQAKAGGATGTVVLGGQLLYQNVAKEDLPSIIEEAEAKKIPLDILDGRVNPEDYPIYPKNSDSAKAFRNAQRVAKRAGADVFRFEDRLYSTKEAVESKAMGGSMTDNTSLLTPLERTSKNIGGKVGGKVISLLEKLGKKKNAGDKSDFANKQFLRDLAEDPEFDEAINNLPENEFVSLMDEMGLDYDAGMGPLSGNVDIAMQLDPEDAAKNYMAFDGFDNLTKYLTGKNAAEIRLFIRTLTDDPDFGDVDSRVVNMAEKILKDKTELRTMKNEGGLTQSEQIRQAIQMSTEDADMPFKGNLTEQEKNDLGIFPTYRQVMRYRNDNIAKEDRQSRERIAKEDRLRSGMSEGSRITNKDILAAMFKIKPHMMPELERDPDATVTIDGQEIPLSKIKGAKRVLERDPDATVTFMGQEIPLSKLKGLAEGGSLMVPDEGIPVDTYPNIPPEEMEEAMASQLPDEQMEDNYIDFIMDKSISEEDQDYLAEKLEQDSRLSDILDSIIVTASEFSGSGEVEGPGSGVSDSIPARLSDGEFVFTRKATDQIGADNLQRMMDDAERAFDGGYQRKAVGGYMYDQDDSEVSSPSTIDEEIKKAMIGSNKIPSLA